MDEEELPPELLDPRNRGYLRVQEWVTNWAEPVNQGVDAHAAWLHRRNLTHSGLRWKYPLMGL